MTTNTPAAGEMPAGFPARIWALLLDVAERNPPEGFGVFEDGNGDPMQDDADVAIAWLAAKNAEIARLQAESERTARNRDMWKGQCERQAEELTVTRAALIDLYAVASVEEDKDYGAVTNAAAVIEAKGEGRG